MPRLLVFATPVLALWACGDLKSQSSGATGSEAGGGGGTGGGVGRRSSASYFRAVGGGSTWAAAPPTPVSGFSVYKMWVAGPDELWLAGSATGLNGAVVRGRR